MCGGFMTCGKRRYFETEKFFFALIKVKETNCMECGVPGFVVASLFFFFSVAPEFFPFAFLGF